MKTLTFVLVGFGSLLALLWWHADAEPVWEFQPDYTIEVAWRLPSGGHITSGHINATGAFIPDLLSVDTTHFYFPGYRAVKPICANDPQLKRWDEVFHQTETVYEFRSGALIIGTLQYPATFIPTVDEPVIWIDEWKSTQKNGKPSPRIWAHPGTVSGAARPGL